LKVTSINGEEIEGYLFAFESRLNCLVLHEKSSVDPKKKNIRIMRASAITDVTILQNSGSSEDGKLGAWNSLSPIDWKQQRAKEEQTIKRLQEEYSRPPGAISIFAALSKTYQCVWDENDIIVMEAIKLSPPYRPEDLSTCSNDVHAEAIVRVKKLLEREYGKLQKEAAAAPPEAPAN